MKNNLYAKNCFRIFFLRMVYVCSFLITGISFGQSVNEAIRVYLSDAETGKNVKDARVTLEGFEIPAIEGKYNKKGKYYYFTEIPQGYNTIMSYHKDYNEKGFQDVKGLSSIVKLQLHDPRNVYYEFESKDEKENNESYLTRLYVEDPYKIGITCDSIKDYNKLKEYIFSEVNKLTTNIEPVNPYFEELIFFKKEGFDQTEPYPDFKTDNGAFHVDYKAVAIPLINGYSTETLYNLKDLYINSSGVVFYFRKKDGTKFKRFNDSNLSILRKIKGVKLHMVVNFKLEHRGNIAYRDVFGKALDKYNMKYAALDPSRFFLYKADYIAKMKKSGKYVISQKYLNETNLMQFQYLVGDKLNFEIMTTSKDVKKEVEDLLEIDGIGLGLLDQYEKISAIINQKFFIVESK